MKKFKELPVEIQEKMLEEQVRQGNKRDAIPFMKNTMAGKANGGFSWAESKDGHRFWPQIIAHGDYYEFNKRYPNEYPKVMWVSMSEDFKIKAKRVVFMEKNGGFIAWGYSETIENSNKVTDTYAWRFAKDIEPTVKVTKQEIAEKFNTMIENLEIT